MPRTTAETRILGVLLTKPKKRTLKSASLADYCMKCFQDLGHCDLICDGTVNKSYKSVCLIALTF